MLPRRFLRAGAARLSVAALAGCGSSALHPISNATDHHKSLAIAACVYSVERTIHDYQKQHKLAALYHADRALKDCHHV
jgi:hypothetical protein